MSAMCIKIRIDLNFIGNYIDFYCEILENKRNFTQIFQNYCLTMRIAIRKLQKINIIYRNKFG